MKQRGIRLIRFAVLLVLTALLACAEQPTVEPRTETAAPVAESVPVEDVIAAAQTAAVTEAPAAPTQEITPEPTETPTPEPTDTPVPTPATVTIGVSAISWRRVRSWRTPRRPAANTTS